MKRNSLRVVLMFLMLIIIDFSVNSQIALTFGTTESRCQSSGTITVNASGGSTPYLYEITSGPVTRSQQVPNVFNALPSGTYNILVTDNLGATQSSSVTVSGSYVTPTAVATTIDESCLGNDGRLTVNATGGRSPYTYELISPSPITVGPQASNVFNNLVSGSYAIRVTDSCGNFYTTNRTVNAKSYSNLQSVYTNNYENLCNDTAVYVIWKNTDTVSYDQFSYPLNLYIINTTDDDTTRINNISNDFRDTLNLERFKSYNISLIDTCGNTDSRYVNTRPRIYDPSVNFDCNTGFYYFDLNAIRFVESTTTYQLISGPITTPSQDTSYFDSLVPGSYTVEVCDCDTCLTRNFSITDFSLTSMNISAYLGCDTGRGRMSLRFNSSLAYPIATILSAPSNFPHPLPYYDTSTSSSASSMTFYDFVPGPYTVAVIDTCGRTDTLTANAYGPVMQLNTNVSFDINCGSNTFEIRDTGYYRKDASGFRMRLLDSNENVLQSVLLPLTYPGGSGGTGVSTFDETFTVTNPGVYYIRYDIFAGSYCPAATRYRYDTIHIDTTATSPQINNTYSFICRDSATGNVIIEANGGVPPLSYEIFSGPATFPSQPDSNFNGLPIGVYQARVVDGCGISTTQGFEVTPYGQSNINFSNPVCLGSNFSAIADTLPGAVYQWTGPNAYVSNNRRLSLSPLTINDTGTYYLDVDFGTCIDTVIPFRVIGDVIPPNVICQDTTVYLDAAGTVTIDSSYVNNGTIDNCGAITMSLNRSSFTCTNIGGNNVTLYATDQLGNTDSCSSVVTVRDTINPIALCQNITVQLDGTGNASITPSQINNGSTDNCGIASLVVSPSTFTCANVGSNSVTLVVTDVNGNVDSCSANVTVQDTISPNALCQNINVYLNASGNASITASQINNSSTDNCNVASLVASPTTFTCANLGANSVSLTVTDVNGNVNSCIATVTVLDTFSSVASCTDTTIYLGVGGNAIIDSSYVITGTGGGCASVYSATISQNSFTCADVGLNTVNVVINGTTNCSSTITVVDTTAPTAVCQNLTVQLNSFGNASISASQVDNGSTDNCSIASVVVTPTLFNCTNVGANPVTLVVTDVNGNIDSCTSIVTIQDTLKPVVSCQDITVQLDATGNASITASQIDNGSTDNCGVASTSVFPNTFDCSDVGANSVRLLVTDVNGNIDSCLATVTVQDTINPVALCQNLIVQLDGAGNASITSSQIDNGSSDNCGIASMTLSQSNFTCLNVGANVVRLVVTDFNGNIDSCTSTVTVQDTVSPIVQVQNTIVYLDSSGRVVVQPSSVDNGSTDNCAIDSIYLTPNTFNCNDIGLNNVTLVVTDVNGNVDSGLATVDVRDDIAPWFDTCGITTVDTVVGVCEYIIPDYMSSAIFYDNCDTIGATISQNPMPGTVINLPNTGISTNYQVDVTVTDVNLNTSTCVYDLQLSCYPELEIPQFISPNGDGQNDVWYIKGIEAFDEHSIKVFNRLGNLVFESNNYQNNWGGDAQRGRVFSETNNSILPSGTYFYIITAKFEDEKIYKGYMYIRR